MFQSRNGAVLMLVEVIIFTQVSRCKYLGCFNTSLTKDALNGSTFIRSNMTTEMCCGMCTSKGWNVYALQYGRYCYCGTHESNYEMEGIAPEGECNTHCGGAPTCGGEAVTSVFEGETYMGCYKLDGSNTFTFGGVVEDLTRKACLDRCDNAFRYMGLKQGNKCYCSNTLPSSYIANNSDCQEDGHKCQGSERCGGSKKIAVWTNIEKVEEDGVEYVGCYRDPGFTLVQPNKQLADCAQLCHVNYSYAGIASNTSCFCGNMLPNEKSSVYKTMKLLHSLNGTVGSYRLEALCNVTHTGYLKVWRLGPRWNNDSCTLLPSEVTNHRGTAQDIQGTMTTMLPKEDNEDVIPWLKVYPFLITSFFLGCITVILFVCLSRSYESRRVMTQVRKQMAKQGKLDLKMTTETLRAGNSNEMSSSTNIIDDNTSYSTVNIASNITSYSSVARTDPVFIHYEEVQKESAESGSACNRQYTKVDLQRVTNGSPSGSNPTKESDYSVPKKPALPTNPPQKIVKQTKKKQKVKEKSKEAKGKTTSRPTYAPPGIHKIKAVTSSNGNEETIPNYSFPTKNVSREGQQLISLQEGESPVEQTERVEFDFQPKNQIRFKKRSMFGENVTKSCILGQGEELSSIYSFPNKTEKRPKSSSEVSGKWKNSLKMELNLPGKECKLEHILEIPSSNVPEAYDESNEDTFTNLIDDVAMETSPKDQGEVNIYHVIDEGKIRRDEIYETIDKQDSSQNELI